ncbi:MAG: serine/threonine protein kinase [Betaproteobacteria bacterium]|nr:serine/threonine protein kinase [Betaproteobacteria bacterium]
MADPQKIGKYEIQDVLGKGGMGSVYRGFDTAISRAVAIKAITKTSLDEDELKHIMQRFRHEAQAVGRLVHPRIVQIYDYGEDDDVAYIVMELVNGKTLAQHLQQEVSYEIREVGEIIRQLLDGLGHAHAAGVIHRDVKPANILINNDGRIKISDFGIARIESSKLTQVGDVLGTPHYMAPEQFMGIDIGLQADLYSVGVIAYELLTGRKPFTGNSAKVMHQVLNVAPENPSSLNAKLSPLVDSALQKALAKKSLDRYPSAREFADEFQAAIDASVRAGVPPAAAGPSPDGSALLSAARLLTTAAAPVLSPAASDLATLATGDSGISLDTGVKQARLLLVDDEERILTALKSLFRQRYHVFTTTDGNKALEFMRKYHVHVVVSDQRMPIMQGVELLRRSQEISPTSVRILLTGYSDLAAIVGSINDGEVYRFISKPWDNTDLATIVAEAATIGLQLADTRTPKAELPAKMDAGVLVIDRNEEIFRVARELVGNICPVVYAPDADAALAVMQAREIGVVITDVGAGHDELTELLKLLKRENPQILTIVATTASDSELVIELINEAQIFRFLNRPVKVNLLKGHLQAALQRYLTFKEAPVLLKALAVEPAAQVKASSLSVRLLDGFKSLRGKWF